MTFEEIARLLGLDPSSDIVAKLRRRMNSGQDVTARISAKIDAIITDEINASDDLAISMAAICEATSAAYARSIVLAKDAGCGSSTELLATAIKSLFANYDMASRAIADAPSDDMIKIICEAAERGGSK
jgi:hypothetical protein